MPTKAVRIGGREIGRGNPVFFVAEIGINHNGDLDIAKKLIDAAALAGCDAVKFQKRTPELCVPVAQQQITRGKRPWGMMTYLDYRRESSSRESDYAEIDRLRAAIAASTGSRRAGTIPSVDFIEQFNPVCYKIASASLTDDELLKRIRATGRPVILSTGMSTMEQIRHAVALLDPDQLLIAHSTSTYPCTARELNLRMIPQLEREFGVPVGYSGHEVGLQTTVAAVALGACFVERHITLDRAMWGTDQAASVEPVGLVRLVRDIRVVEQALGDGVKRVYDSEIPVMKKLRRVQA